MGDDLDDTEAFAFDQRVAEIGGQEEKVQADRASRKAGMKGR